MKKGIIMEIDDAFLTLLTPEGEFFQSRKGDHPYSVGEEIHFFPIESVKPKRAMASFMKMINFKMVWGVMAALLIFLGSLIPMYQNNKAYAYMSIDANPSIELGVNNKMQVVELIGFNEEGKKIISELHDWKKKDVSELIKSVLVEMKKAGFLSTNKDVLISTVRIEQPDEGAEKELKENMNEIKKTVIKQHLDLTVLTATEEEREKAKELGVSTGKYQENQASKKEKRNRIEYKQKQNTLLSEQNKEIPPGLQKKHADSVQNNGLTEKRSNNEANSWDGKSTPPGQLKKADDIQRGQEGQVNQPSPQQESANKQNHGQEKKQLQTPENTQKKNNTIQNQKENGNKQQNNQNQKNQANQNQKENDNKQQNNQNQQNNQANQKEHKNK